MENTLIQINEEVSYSTVKDFENQSQEFKDWFAEVSKLPCTENFTDGRLDSMTWTVDGFRIEERFIWKNPAWHADNYVRLNSTFTLTVI
jgi:hypothetical protein